MQDRLAYIALNMIEGLGPVSVRRLVDTLGSPKAILEADREALMEARGVGEKLALRIITQRDSIDTGEEIDKAADLGARIITPLDDEYPGALKSIHGPLAFDLALWVKCGRPTGLSARPDRLYGGQWTGARHRHRRAHGCAQE